MTLEAPGNADVRQTGGIDPAIVLAVAVTLAPSVTVKLAFVTAVGKTRAAALMLAHRFSSLHAAKWAIRDAAQLILPLLLPVLAGFLMSFQQAMNGTATMHYGTPIAATSTVTRSPCAPARTTKRRMLPRLARSATRS